MASRKSSHIMVLLTTLLIWLLFFTPTAIAFFGKECDKPKESYQKFLQSAQRLQAQDDWRKKVQEQKRQQFAKKYKSCQRNPDKFFRKNSRGTSKYDNNNLFRCSDWYRDMISVPVPLSSFTVSAFSEYKRAMQVVKSYKKCFDPEKYIGAIEWLRKNRSK